MMYSERVRVFLLRDQSLCEGMQFLYFMVYSFSSYVMRKAAASHFPSSARTDRHPHYHGFHFPSVIPSSRLCNFILTLRHTFPNIDWFCITILK